MTGQKLRSATRFGWGQAIGAMLASMVGVAAPASAQIFDPAFSASTNGIVRAIAVQADGKVLLGGAFTQVNGVTRSRLARLNADGSLDTAFTTTVTADEDYGVAALAVLPNGDILVGGDFSQIAGVTRGRIARLLPDGTVDPTFTAKVANDEAPAFGVVYTVVVQPDGKILIGGGDFNLVNGVARSGLARLNADGTLDGAFAPSFDDLVDAIAVQPNGAIVVGGDFSMVNGIAKPYLARLNAGGSLDTSFAPPIAFRAGGIGVYAVAIRTDGHILVGGIFTLASTTMRLAQLHADGSQDTSFNVPVLVPGGNAAFLQVDTIVLQGDGRILIGGFFNLVDGINTFAAARLLPDGTLDSSFGTTGGGSISNTITTIVLQPDDKVLIGGTIGLSNVARLLPSSPSAITLVVPSSGQQGQTLDVIVTGQSTNFVQGTTTASFGAGITVNSTTVQSLTQATANVTIAAGAAPGARTVTLTTGGEVAALASGFTVTAATPAITQVAPTSGQQGANLNVVVTGVSTHFLQGTTTASLGTGITVNSTTVQSATQATANVTIAAGAAPGARAVTLTTGSEVVSLAGGFTVTFGTPALSLVSPSSGRRSANLSVSLTGQLTHFVQGQTTANFGAGITVNSTAVLSATQATASVTIAGNAALGPRTVTLTTGGEIVGLNGGFVVTALTLTTGDFDGDGKADITVFRPSTGTWYVRYSATGTSTGLVWGGQGDVPVPGDYDGDGKADIAVFRPSTGTWYVRYSGTGTSVALVWGGQGDVPVQGDYDGDGLTDIAIFRPSTGTWYVRYSATGTSAALVWGGAGDVPVIGDYDGDGITDIAIFRPSTGTWYVRYSATGISLALVWGGVGDITVPGDYDGDGKADIAVFRPSTGTWYIRASSGVSFPALVWGGVGDIAVPGDFDGDGRTDIAVFRPSTGTWYVRYSATGTSTALVWGGTGDIPILHRP